MGLFCGKCGKEAAAGDLFCGSCGASLAGTGAGVEPKPDRRRLYYGLVAVAVVVLGVFFAWQGGFGGNGLKSSCQKHQAVFAEVRAHFDEVARLKGKDGSEAARGLADKLTKDRKALKQLEGRLQKAKPSPAEDEAYQALLQLNGKVQLMLEEVSFVLQDPLQSGAGEAMRSALKRVNEVREEAGRVRLEGVSLQEAVAFGNVKISLQVYVSEAMKQRTRVLERDFLLTQRDNVYPYFWHKDTNYPFLEGHMEAGCYLLRDSVRVEDGNGEEPVLSASAIWVPYVGQEKEKPSKAYVLKIKYYRASRTIACLRGGQWTPMPTNGSMSKIRGIKTVAEAAYYVAYKQPYFQGFTEVFYRRLRVGE